MPIQTLTLDVISKIAAGEVVERPASVVKELVENSLDAGATRITVEARGGGVSLIRVADNGSGISPDEVELAFLRHATSKIHKATDLGSVSTLGFRGEALPSIAVVAQVEMLTRTPEDQAGTFVSVRHGAVAERRQRGCRTGTTVTVRQLFQNVPARFKFLKSATTESSHISNVVSQYSLAFPEVGFTLYVDGRLSLQTQGNGELRDVLVQLYGLQSAEQMLTVGEKGAAVWGFVSSPSIARSSRSHLSFFVNRRWVRSPLLSRAVDDAYHGLLMVGRHPVAVLNIALAHEEVDVNVHPAKIEVRFRSERELFSSVERAVRAALVEQLSVPESRRQPAPLAGALPQQGDAQERALPKQQEFLHGTVMTRRQSPGAALPVLRVLGQLSGTYIIAEGPDGLYLIDQHAAHERVLFEKVRAQQARGAVEVQGLLEPLTVEVTPRQAEALKARAELLTSYGFAIEPFGQQTYLVRAVPAMVKGNAVNQVVTDIIDSLAGDAKATDLEDRITASVACHSAVKSGDTLSMEEMRSLVRDMESSESPHTCPHGRPTMIRLTSAQLEREFGRIG